MNRIEFLGKVKLTSDDPDTKIACVIMAKSADNTAIWIYDSNRLTDGISVGDVSLERPEKYDWIEHAERNAIYKCAKLGVATEGAKMHLTGFPCVECARAIVQAGIVEIHCQPAEFFDVTRYKFDKSRVILEKGGVSIFEDYE